MAGRKWTQDEFELLKKLYNEDIKFQEIAKIMNRSVASIQHKSNEMKLCNQHMKKNNTKYKAIYQDYDWCYERFIEKNMSYEEMATEAHTTPRTIQKWCSEKHRLNQWTFRSEKHLNEIQRQIILFGTLGDGHIDNRENCPMYIECHSDEEKEYLFWKYSIIKDICNKEPVWYPASYNNFGLNKYYLCKPFYRLNTKIIDELIEIRNMSRIDKINQLNEFGLSLHMLDDGYRSNLWELCLAEYTEEEINRYINICKDKFNINCNIEKDDRYVLFDAISSKTIDEIILRNIPNDLDIIKKKITNNDKINELCHYVYIISNDGKIGISRYCKINHINYEKLKKQFNIDLFDGMKDYEFLEYISGDKNEKI